MAMSRKPLSARNNGHNPRFPSSKAAKKPRYPFGLLNRATLVSELKQNSILKPSTSVSEEDLLKPTPDKVQQMYFDCLEFVFGVKAESLKMPSFRAHVADHPELMDDFVYRIQFFRLMKRFMQACLVNDFRLEDLMFPDPKKTCRNLSAIINFIKFHFRVFLNAGDIQEYHETRDQLKLKYEGLIIENEQLQQQRSTLEKQKREENEHEQELKARISQQEQDMHSLQLQKESLQKQYDEACDQKLRCEQRLAELGRVLEKWTLRDSDLRKQVVSSPDKLKARLRHLQEEMAEAKEAAKDTEALLRMWESLASKAHQIPSLLGSLNDDLNRLLKKSESRDELQAKVESMEEQLTRQRQLLREATAKHQNLIRHLKLVEAESSRVTYDDTNITHAHSKEELHRDVCLLEQELLTKEAFDEKLRHELEAEKEKFSVRQGEYQKACSEITDVTEALSKAAHSQFREYGELMVQFGLDLYKDKD